MGLYGIYRGFIGNSLGFFGFNGIYKGFIGGSLNLMVFQKDV